MHPRDFNLQVKNGIAKRIGWPKSYLLHSKHASDPPRVEVNISSNARTVASSDCSYYSPNFVDGIVEKLVNQIMQKGGK